MAEVETLEDLSFVTSWLRKQGLQELFAPFEGEYVV